MKLQNKKTTLIGYVTVILALASLADSFLRGEPIDLQTILMTLGVGGAGVGALHAKDGGL